MPTEFTIEYNETITAVREAQIRFLDFSDVDKLISERGSHADKALSAEIKLTTLSGTDAPALAHARARWQQEEHEREIEQLDPVIFGALLERAIRQPERQDEAQLLAWKMPTEFTIQFNETITAVREAQAQNFDLPGIEKLISEREGQARAIDRDEWNAQLKDMIAEGRKRQAEEQERQAAHAPKPKPAAPELGRIDAGIRLAYSLTGTGQEFADAIEDRSFIAARVTEADAARLNRWERQRLKELKELEDALLLKERFRDAGKATTGKAPSPALDEQQKAAGKKRSPELARADTWMAQTGGFEKLPPELQEKAQANYDKWSGDKEKYDLADYVSYVQAREAKRRAKQEPEEEKLYEKYKAGELVVIDQWGGVHQLNYRNTGDTLKDRENHLRDIALTPLMSVTSAQAVMKEFQQHRQEERRQDWQAKGEEWLRQVAEEHWPAAPPQPERKSPGLFEQAAIEANRDSRTDLHGTAAQVWTAFRQSGNEEAFKAVPYYNDLYSVTTGNRKAFAAALDDKGIAFAAVTKEESARSHKEAAFARAIGNYAPRFKEGEIVIVTEPRLEYRRAGELTEPRRVHKLDQSLAGKFITLLDNRSQLQGIDATLKASDDRFQQRRNDKATERLERATSINAGARTRPGKAAAKAPTIGKAAARALDGLLNIGGGLLAHLDTPKSPQLQERENREGERATRDRTAEAEIKTDLAAHAAARKQHEARQQEREAERQQHRDRDDGGGRER